ncbi:filamentous hemagglutinin N-terminal domain-containing protein, partial [Cellvibrio sp. BR]|uniref:filamentous hemagglutinin N-terminal domain-containing protein n=1 Tax=Cellvibrio sp. BR TaxID=1134474 RepID=UPI0018DED8E7
MSNTLLPKSLPSLQQQSHLSRRKLYAAMLVASQWMAAGHLHAAPEGGEVVAGEGTITQTGVDTLIQQASDRMAIDWRSFDVAANERVEFIQPSSSSIALNRVLSNNGSKILGRIDANGQVMLVNANGVVFGKDSVINVGGMIASGMSIDPESFINGDFTLNSIEGTEGKVINYGIINAATGGSVTLVGQQVQNDGLISAKLGAVNLAAGNEAVLTFDQSGLVGVKVTEAVLQNELGVDAAVINNGDIIAEGGRVLLSASVSEDIFSNAVNNAGMNKASSVVVHDDGSFTLGAGADVINTGDIDTSVATGAAGQVVVVGNNITSSGTITANTNSGTAGAIELHSTDTTLVTETGNVSAQAAAQGEGGDIKILGNKVGLFDSAEINASGANGGGQVLIGGDKTGDNQKIRNADFIYLGENTAVKTDALINGNGGKLITFASDTARIYGNLYSRGGSEGGNGGFIETSGLKGFEILNTPDITAAAGTGGTWLIDPYDIVIDSDDSTSIITSNSGKTFTSNNTAILRIDILRDSLTNGSTVIVQTGGSASDGDNSDTDMGNITLDKGLNFNFSDNATLRLLAHNNIILNENIQRKNDNVTGTLNLELIANKDDLDGGDITVASGKTIATNGGYFYAGVRPAVDTEDTDGFLNSDIDSPTLGTFTSTGATIDTTGDLGGGDIVINATNNVTLGLVAFGYNYLNANFGGTNPDKAELIRVGSLTIDSKADVTLNDAIDFNNTGKRTNAGGKGYSGNLLDGEETFLRIDAFGNIEIKGLISDADYGDARDALNIDLTAGKNNTSGGDIKIEADIYTAGGNFTATSTTFTSTGRLINTERANASLVDITTNTNGNGQPNGNAQWSNGGNVTINAGTNIALGDITTDGSCLAPSVCTGILSLAVTDIVLDPDQQPNVVITQAPGSVLKIAGDATFNAGTNGDIKLTNNNIFNGNLLFTSARDVELTGITALTQPTDTTAVTFGKSQINRNLTLTSGGGVTQVNDLYVGGETKLTFTGADKSINLSTHVNDFVGKISLTNNVSHLLLSDINNLSLDAVTLVAGADASIGNIELTSGDAYSIILNGNLNSANGTTKNITLNSNVTLASDVELNAGTGNILFSGTINSNDNTTPRNLTVTGSKSFISGGITTAGGDVKITASDSISVNSIDTSADTAGLIALTVNGSDAARSITVNGDLNAQNTVVGQKSVDLTLASDSAGGSVKLNFTPTSNSYLSSDISVNGSAGLGQTLTAVNANNTWNLTAENAGTIEKTGSTSKIITFIGFENINGGEQVDTFNITDNISTSVNGGSGDDVFNINVATIDALLNGDTGADTFNIVTTDAVTATLNGGGDTDTLVSAAAGANNWMLGATESLNSSIDFSNIENLMGNNDVDTFRFNGIRASTGVINASGSEDIVEVLSDAEIDFSGVFSFFGITNAEVLESINGGILRTLSNELDVIQWTFNATANSVTDGTNLVKFTGFTSYIGGEGDDNFSVENNITFAGLVDGSDGNNIFDFSDATEAYSIVLSSAYQTDSSATLSNFSEIKANSHTGTSLEAIAGTNFWEVTAKDSGKVGNTTFTGVSTIIGASPSDSISTSINGHANWSIKATDPSTLSDSNDPQNVLISFSNIGKLVGSIYNDTFAFETGASIVSAEGGAGSGTDTADFSELAARTITIGAATEFSFTGVERFKADVLKAFVLTASSGATWTIDNSGGEIDGTVGNIEFVGFKTLQGSNANDTFNLITNFGGVINAEGGDDTFEIRNGYTGELQGGNGVDTFAFFDGGSIGTDGIVNAGDGLDQVDLRALSTGVTVVASNSMVYGVANVERVIADSNKGFTLTAGGTDNAWHIYDFDGSGTVANGANDGVVAGIQFVDFSTLTGGALVDTFTIDSNFTGTISGGDGADIFNINAVVTNISGGIGNDSFVFFNTGSVTTASGDDGNDIVDFRNINASHTVTLDGTRINNVDSISRVIANNAFDFTLAANAGSNTWRIYDFDGAGSASDGVNDGELAGIQFIDFKNLQGGSGVDTFDIDTNFTGTISGGSGADIFNIKAAATNITGGADDDSFVFYSAGSVTTASGNDGNDIVDFRNIAANRTVTLSGTSINNVASVSRVIANSAFDFTLAATSGTNSWRVYDFDGAGNASDGVNDGEVAGIQFVDFKNLQGGLGVDSFDIDTNFSGTISGGDGADIFNIKALVNTIAGGDGDDQFVFYTNGSVITASGDDGNDIVDFRNIAANHTVTLNGTSINNVASVSRVIANSAFDFTLAATAGTNSWRVYDFDGAGSTSDGV